MRPRLPLSFGLLLFFVACGGATTMIDAGDAGDAGHAGIDGAADQRIAANHRAAGSVCPQTRGSAEPDLEACAPDGGFLSCVQDTDCTAGANGRCLAVGPIACGTACSYDTCSIDSECPDNQPCVCRASSTGWTANSCTTGGNCRVDADCGPGGSCSPSQVDNFCFCPATALCGPDVACSTCAPGGPCMSVPCACGDSCGHAYFCHTRQDDCVDDSDCTNSDTCNYDTLSNRWTCGWCIPLV